MSDFIDTHAHLYLPEFDADRDGVIETAVHRGVTKIFLPNIDSSSIIAMNMLADRYPDVCYPMMGLHPTSVKDNFRDELKRVELELRLHRYCGIGEIGIDLYWDKVHLKEQCLAFTAQLDLALEHKLPVVIHARESFGEILEILGNYKNKELRGIFHAFTGTVDIAKQVTAMGFMLGIGGIVTYKKSSLPDVIREIAMEWLVLETDSPYLTPVPFRGKRNESSFIPYIADAIKQIKNIALDEIARITSANACNVFQLDRYVRD
jgi:TatD DNase family protein